MSSVNISISTLMLISCLDTVLQNGFIEWSDSCKTKNPKRVGPEIVKTNIFIISIYARIPFNFKGHCHGYFYGF